MEDHDDEDWALESGLKSAISMYTDEDWNTDSEDEDDSVDSEDYDNGGDKVGSDWDTGEDTGLGTTTSGSSGEDEEESDSGEDEDDSEQYDEDEDSDEATEFKPSFHGDSYHYQPPQRPESAPFNTKDNIVIATDDGNDVDDPMYDDEFLETIDDDRHEKPTSDASIESEEEVRALIRRLICFMVCCLIIIIGATLPIILLKSGSGDDDIASVSAMPSVVPTLPPTTSLPSLNPTKSFQPTTSSPSSSPTPIPFQGSTIIIRYDVVLPNGEETNATSLDSVDDFIEGMNLLAVDVLNTFNIGGEVSNTNDVGLQQATRRLRLFGTTTLLQQRRQLQEAQIQLPTSIINIRQIECPVNAFVAEADRCEEISALVTLLTKFVQDASELKQQYTLALRIAIENGGMQDLLNQINPTLDRKVFVNIPGTTDEPTVTPSSTPSLSPSSTPSFILNCSEYYYLDSVIIEVPHADTTPMAPYENDCTALNDMNFPHVLDQCTCGEMVLSKIPVDVAAFATSLWNDTELFPIVYGSDLELISIIYDDIGGDMGNFSNVTNGTIYDNVNATAAASPFPSCNPFNMALFWLSSGSNHKIGDMRQRFILALTYFKLGGMNWLDQKGWLSTASECEWFGITCNDNDVVTSLEFDGNDAVGQLPTELGRLDGMSSLQIQRSELTGSIPPSLFALECLQVLDLGTNQLTGSLLQHSDFDNNTVTMDMTIESRLERLSVTKNSFDGQLGPGIGKLTALTHLDVATNTFTGSIPSEIGMLTLLEHLDVALNNLNGTLPSEIGHLTNLNFVELNNCQLTGTIPSEIGNCTSLNRFRIQNNKFEGTLPSTLGLISSLQVFTSEGNLLTGESPPEVCSLRGQSLVAFTVDCPNITEGAGINCTIPTCCTGCS